VKRREVIAGLGSAAAWPVGAGAVRGARAADRRADALCRSGSGGAGTSPNVPADDALAVEASPVAVQEPRPGRRKAMERADAPPLTTAA
jgi:hypothetical protein